MSSRSALSTRISCRSFVGQFWAWTSGRRTSGFGLRLQAGSRLRASTAGGLRALTAGGLRASGFDCRRASGFGLRLQAGFGLLTAGGLRASGFDCRRASGFGLRLQAGFGLWTSGVDIHDNIRPVFKAYIHHSTIMGKFLSFAVIRFTFNVYSIPTRCQLNTSIPLNFSTALRLHPLLHITA